MNKIVKSKFLNKATFGLLVFANLNAINIIAKDLHCYIPLINRTQNCKQQAKIDKFNRALNKSKKAAIVTNAHISKDIKAVEPLQPISAKPIPQQTSKRHWYNLWRFWA